MEGKSKFWLKVALIGGFGALIMLAIVNRVHFIRKVIGT